ncbi:MAG: MEKHLA domain-containing protein [Actinomycetota bacterium]
MHRSIDPEFFALLTGSYQRLVGTTLVPEGAGAEWLYEQAPFAVLAHDASEDPKFIYANKCAQACFEYDVDEITTLPSRLSADLADRAERQVLLDAVAQHGFMSGYRGVRVAKSGRRFLIEDGVVWELIDAEGLRHGQAAAFSSWRNV